MNRKYLVALALAAVGVYFFASRRKDEAPAAVVGGSGFTKTVEGSAIFTRPNGLTRAPLVIVYGGILSAPYARKEAMEQAAPAALKSRAMMLFVNLKTGTAASFAALGKQLAAKYGLTVTDTKLVGFSGGGNDVQDGFSPDFSFIGLIDPSTNARYLKLPWSSKARMIYNVANWSTKYGSIRSALPQIAAAINAAGGKAQSLAVSHRDMVPKFFALYANELATPA
jgi:hypothetical protein